MNPLHKQLIELSFRLRALALHFAEGTTERTQWEADARLVDAEVAFHERLDALHARHFDEVWTEEKDERTARRIALIRTDVDRLC